MTESDLSSATSSSRGYHRHVLTPQTPCLELRPQKPETRDEIRQEMLSRSASDHDVTSRSLQPRPEVCQDFRFSGYRLEKHRVSSDATDNLFQPRLSPLGLRKRQRDSMQPLRLENFSAQRVQHAGKRETFVLRASE